MKNIIQQLESKQELIEYIVATDEIIGAYTEKDDPKHLHELHAADRDTLEDYLYIHLEYMKLLTNDDTVH